MNKLLNVPSIKETKQYSLVGYAINEVPTKTILEGTE